MLKMSAIILCFVVVNLGTSWAMLNHVRNIFYSNYVILIFTLNILQGLMFGKSGTKGLSNVLSRVGNVLGFSRSFLLDFVQIGKGYHRVDRFKNRTKKISEKGYGL